MTRKRKVPKAHRDTKRFKEYADVEPDPKSEDFFYDEVDQHNINREKILLSDTYQRKKKTVVEEEILPVEDSYDEEEEDETIDAIQRQLKQLRAQTDARVALLTANDYKEEQEEEGPKETTWGRKRVDEYGADVSDDVEINDSEENAALLEEKEALAIQKHQLEQIDESDFDFQRYKTEITALSTSGERSEKEKSELTVEEKQEVVKRENPELLLIYSDTIRKCAEVRKTLCPIVEAYQEGCLPKHEVFNFLQKKLGLYFLHFANTAFYRALKLNKMNTHNHPVVATIFDYIERFKKLAKVELRYAAAIHYTLKMLKQGKPELVTVDRLNGLLKAEDDSAEMVQTTKRVKFADMKKSDALVEMPKQDEPDDNGERIVDYKIAKNKGLTPKRKKENRNPRIRYKEKYRRALIRRRGQVPQPRTEMHPYAGELSGIRAGIKRGIKLKV